ncbi:3-keto-disaccharide hydrolase [Thalassoglobus polymorphus]|uniref:3-keto-alpha-glucoside-1,2-lyase/3-keto-2-hydroxy-glucal hydratase domain-containing protein n=1 Tax=Thalassoglobus polymorphus TaxID=2527994 RepID=A0A517QI29_9PLAN|nr:DUF1080 domain-containing protein [Thalassoglobus polymorphus]QDT31299.1 hypothetical protein Mal48_05320 [Thalassoglobus polymorphus]
MLIPVRLLKISSVPFCFAVAVFLASSLSAEEKKEKPVDAPKGEVIKLFDGKSLKNWKVTDFGGEGTVLVKDGQLILEPGDPITGVHWVGKELPNVNYEISFDAQRVDGNDFFCALTFPVKEKLCSLILGGWGGSLIGLSNINDFDASENESTDYYSFDNEKWYKIRLRVDEKFIQAWIDETRITKIDHTENRISIRIEMELSKPLGLASFQTKGAIKNLKMTKLKPEVKKKD